MTAGRIVVTQAKIEQIASLFARTWQRPPTSSELKGLIDDYVKEEVYYREAFALGLDKDDTVIRRRLRLKMEFLNDAVVEALAPTDAELDAYLQGQAGAFEIEPMLAFQQVFLKPDRHGDRIDQDAASILEVLLTSPAIDPASLGDASLLPVGACAHQQDVDRPDVRCRFRRSARQGGAWPSGLDPSGRPLGFT